MSPGQIAKMCAIMIHKSPSNEIYISSSIAAKFLEITTGSASTNLKSLKQKGFVTEDENRFISLSEQGRGIAEAILHRRTILEEFFSTVLGVSSHQAEVDACKTEHLLSAETTAKMAQFAKEFSGNAKRANS